MLLPPILLSGWTIQNELVHYPKDFSWMGGGEEKREQQKLPQSQKLFVCVLRGLTMFCWAP